MKAIALKRCQRFLKRLRWENEALRKALEAIASQPADDVCCIAAIQEQTNGN